MGNEQKNVTLSGFWHTANRWAIYHSRFKMTVCLNIANQIWFHTKTNEHLFVWKMAEGREATFLRNAAFITAYCRGWIIE